MKLSYRPAAKADIHETREWYRKQARAQNDAVVVLAVLHGKRHPDTWKR